MIKEIDDLLWQWGEWVDRRESNGLGYQLSSLNLHMAAACTDHPEPSRRSGVDGRIEELMSLVDVLLCRKVSASSKSVIDRFYRGRIGGEIAVATPARRPRSNSHTSVYAAEAGVNRLTIQRWVHNAQVELQKALAEAKTGVRHVGVMGVVACIQAQGRAANDKTA